MHYFDSNATYPVSKQVKKVFCESLNYGNVSSTGGMEVKRIMDNLRDTTLEMLGLNGKIIWTSGGSESNSTIIHHVLNSNRGKIPIFALPRTGHSSTTEYLQKLKDLKLLDIVWIETINGIIQRKNLSGVDCLLLQSVCSETGSIQPMHIFSKFDGIIAVDHVQGFGKVSVDLSMADFVSCSYHKIGAPIGLGMLYVKGDLIPMIGGKQNDGLRGGTYNMAGICASIEALKLYKYPRMKEHFLKEMSKHVKVMPYTNYRECDGRCFVYMGRNTVDSVVFGSFINNGPICGGEMKQRMQKKGYIIGTGSACSTNQTSHYGSLRSEENIPELLKIGFIRISFHQKNTEREISLLVRTLCEQSHFIG